MRYKFSAFASSVIPGSSATGSASHGIAAATDWLGDGGCRALEPYTQTYKYLHPIMQISIRGIAQKKHEKQECVHVCMCVSRTEVCEELECLLAASEEIPLMVSLLRVLGLISCRPGSGPTNTHRQALLDSK